MPNPTVILPYIVEDKARKKPFTFDMEISAVLCLAEAQRKKPGILDASSEKISFISKLHYPTWAVPWKNSCLLVDGLDIFSYSFPYAKLPDVGFFTEEIRGSVVQKEQFRDALKSQVLTFEKPELTSISLEAIFAEERLLSIISEDLEQVSARKEGQSDRVALLPPKLSEKAALEKAERAVNFWKQIQSEIKGLQYAVNIINEETSFEEEMILREIENVRELYETKIAPLRPVVEKKVEKLVLKRDAKIAKLNKSIDRKLASKLKERRRHERELERLERNLVEYKTRQKKSKRRSNDVSASKWEHRIQVYQNKLSETRRRLESVLELIEDIKKQGEHELQEVKASYQVLIASEERKILDLEASRDLEIESRKNQIAEIKSRASAIIEQIWRLIELKKSEASKIEKAKISQRIEEIALICLPFYLVRYEAGEKARYAVFSPAVAMDFKGILRKLQKAIHRFSLRSRIKLLLRSKSTSLEEMLRRVLLDKIRRDNALEEVVCELGVSNNILHNSDLKENLTKGIEELKKEGWINREEKEALLKLYL